MSSQSNKLVIGRLELDGFAEAISDPSFYFQRDRAIALQPMFKEFNQRNREPTNGQALDEAHGRYHDGGYELTHESSNDITVPGGALALTSFFTFTTRC